MSQGARSSCSAFSVVGKLEEDESVLHVFDDRRRTGGRREYLCRLQDGEVGDGGSRWLKEDEVPGEQLTVWEAGEAARNDKLVYARAADKRKAKRDGEKATLVASFKSTEWGRLLLSQKIVGRKDTAPNRKPDCETALTEMGRDDFMIHTIATCSRRRFRRRRTLAIPSDSALQSVARSATGASS